MAPREQEELLVIGDVHIGRRPVGLDEALGRLGLDARELSPEAALERTVAAALASPPRAVLFAGDLVDDERDRYEAPTILERHVRRLVASEVPVLAIAGNHDASFLPRLVGRVSGMCLVGTGGTWERVEIPGPGRPIDLFGWSFPRARVTECPLDLGDFEAALAGARPGAKRIGLLHTDLDGSGSTYAPTPRRRLEEAGLDGWLLGHVHAPSLGPGRAPIGYLGSLVGLDAGEPGQRGPWRVRAGEGGLELRQLACGPVFWQTVEVTLEDADTIDAEAVQDAIERELRSFVGAQLDPAVHDLAILRVELVGTPTNRDAVAEYVRDQGREASSVEGGDVPILATRVTNSTRAPIDLEALAEEPTPLGGVARALIAFQRTGELPEAARRAYAETRAEDWLIDPDDAPAPSAGEQFERAAWRALEDLLGQREEAGR